MREFSKKVSKIVRRFNEITNQLCNNCNVNSSNGDVDFHVFTSVCVYIHNIIPVLEDISIFAELGEELTKLVKECRDVAGEDKTYDDIIRNYEITVKYFKLFNALVKFCNRNYNVAVTSAINRRGYMCMVSNLVGYYCKLSDNAIQYHESLCSLHSSISYADYYTSRNNNSEDGGGNSSSEKSNADVAKTMASFYDQFDKSEDSKKNKNKTSNEILIKMPNVWASRDWKNLIYYAVNIAATPLINNISRGIMAASQTSVLYDSSLALIAAEQATRNITM